jgi:hypothetical protein
MRRQTATCAILLAATYGCSVTVSENENREPRRESVTIDRGKAEMVRAEVRMAVGELRVSGGSSKLLEAEFRYNLPFLKPEVRYDATGFRGHLTVENKSNRDLRLGGEAENTWDLRLNNDTPLDLILHMGAGESRFEIGSLDLRRVEVHLGVGEVYMDLRGEPKRDFDVEVRGGVGEATIHLPKTVGVVAEARGGIGGIEVRGLRKDGDRWVNSLYGTGKPTVRVDVRGGVGSIELIGD